MGLTFNVKEKMSYVLSYLQLLLFCVHFPLRLGISMLLSEFLKMVGSSDSYSMPDENSRASIYITQ